MPVLIGCWLVPWNSDVASKFGAAGKRRQEGLVCRVEGMDWLNGGRLAAAVALSGEPGNAGCDCAVTVLCGNGGG